MDYTPNQKMQEVSDYLEDRVEDLLRMYENMPRWRWIRRRDLLILINAVGIMQYAAHTASHTYKLED